MAQKCKARFRRRLPKFLTPPVEIWENPREDGGCKPAAKKHGKQKWPITAEW
jgi:hypothetical protein